MYRPVRGDMPMSHTRRAVMSGLATAPLAAAATASSPAAPDPIFAVIEWHRRACAVLVATDEMADPGFYAVAEDEFDVSGEALCATMPTSLAGCRALAAFIAKDAGDDNSAEFDLGRRALIVLIAALDRIENQAA